MRILDCPKRWCVKTHPTKNFTLIELLVVVAIIAVLVALLLPGLANARALAKETVCRAHIKQMDTAFTMYLHDNSDYFVHMAVWPPLSRTGSPHYDWPGYYAKYLSMPANDKVNSLAWQASPMDTVFHCPSWTTYSYGLNVDIGGDVIRGVHRLSWEQNPAYTLRLAEPSHLLLPHPSWVVGVGYCRDALSFDDRHRGGALYLFCDGHVQWYKYEGWLFSWNNRNPRICDH